MKRASGSSSSASSANRRAAAGSRSMAISVPADPIRSATSSAWPPPPKVQSTAVSPGCGSRRSISSVARTGTCSVGMYVSVAIGRGTSAGARPAAGELLGDLGCSLVDLGVVLVPGARVPDLQVVGDPDDDAGALLQGRMLDEMLGD